MKLLISLLLLCGVLLAADKPGVWLDVPFVKQEKNGCGAATIAMVMQYWFQHTAKPQASGADAAEIQRALYSREAHGIYNSDLEHYFQEHGFRTFAFRGTRDDLQHHLEKGRPLIVALKPQAHSSELHYVVVTGLDRRQGIVFLNDPAQ